MNLILLFLNWGRMTEEQGPRARDRGNLPAGTRLCENVGFWLLLFGRDVGQRRSNVVFPTSLLRPKSNIVTALCFRRRFSDQILTL